MAGRFDIQRFPKTLLDLLGMKGTGDTPQSLAQEVSASVEVLPLYLIDRTLDIYSGALVVNAATQLWPIPPSTPSFQVPAGEVWQVLGMSVWFSNGAGVTTTGVAFGIQRNTASSTLNVDMVSDTMQVVAPSSNVAFGRTWAPGELLMLPGDIAGFWVATLAGGNSSCRFKLRYAATTI